MKSCHELLISTSDVLRVQLLELACSIAALVSCDWLLLNDRCPNTDAFTSFIHKMGIFCTSYAQQIQRQTCSKPQTKFLHRSNPASHFKMAPQKKATLYVCSPVSHSEKIVLQQSHVSRMAQATLRIPFF